MQSDRERTFPDILILFPDDWAAYSPTLTRLTAQLRESFAVRVYALDTGRTDVTSLDPLVYQHVHIASGVARLLRKMGLYGIVRTAALALSARRDAAHALHVIAIDADGACAARILNRKFHFLSLEIGWHPLLRRLVQKYALSITIQSLERLGFQFDPQAVAKIPTFIVQNAPSSAAHRLARPLPRSFDPDRPRFVHLGHSLPIHGLFPMLELVRAWPEATLTLQGIQPERSLRMIRERYGELIQQGRVCIGEGYVPEAELERFLTRFDIGLCLYELGWRHRRNFNYISSPAGKIFNYFLAGLPVIASNQIGLSPVSRCKAGIQVSSNSVQELQAAARTILADYENYSAACLDAAAHYDFKRSANPFVALLNSGTT